MLKEMEIEDIRRHPRDGDPAGYAHSSYIQTLSEFGEPLQLNRSGSWLLIRTIPGTDATDGIGAYPFFACEDFTALMTDLESLSDRLVSVAFVTDPSRSPPPKHITKLFDVAILFKTHFLADLHIDFNTYLHRHHRRNAIKGRNNVIVQLGQQPSDYATEWADLYALLVARHQISGLRAFSCTSLASQLAVPGCHYFRASRNGVAVGALVCYLDRGVAYAHLISTTPQGQQLMAQYALYWEAIEYFRTRARWFVIGSTPGLTNAVVGTGLAVFKAGWATATCKTHFYGHILDRPRYNHLCALSGHDDATVFPVYRGGVFG